MPGKCGDFISNLNDFIDGGLDPELCEEISRHIGDCDNCRIMVDTLKQTVTLCRGDKVEKLPEELEKKLTARLKKRWDQKFGPQQN